MRQVDQSLAELAFQADSGDAEAQYRMGLIFLLGESVEQDADAALKWIARAASGQHSEAKSLAAKLVLRESSACRDTPASLPGQGIERAKSFFNQILLWARAVVLETQKKTLLLWERRTKRITAGMHFKAGADFPRLSRTADRRL